MIRETSIDPKPFTGQNTMKLNLVRHLWGVSAPLKDAFHQFKSVGYQTIEGHPSGPTADLVHALRAEHGMSFIGMVFTNGPDVDSHFDAFRLQIDNMLSQGATQITAHSGSDAWSMRQSVEFFGRVAEFEKSLPVVIGHETHRGRILFNPWITRDVLTQCPAIKLTIDLSHFVCVAERLNWDEDGLIDLFAERCVHLHARVGYEEGPQVPDPSAPEYARHVETHFQWWKSIWNIQRASGRSEFTITPEFGPPGYLHTIPHTNVPVADLTTVVDWMSRRLRAEFA
jgi:Xylose isomerase-like TIM barrel